jgi:hypothetical protein
MREDMPYCLSSRRDRRPPTFNCASARGPKNIFFESSRLDCSSALSVFRSAAPGEHGVSGLRHTMAQLSAFVYRVMEENAAAASAGERRKRPAGSCSVWEQLIIAAISPSPQPSNVILRSHPSDVCLPLWTHRVVSDSLS